MKQAASARTRVSRQKNLFVLVALSLMAVGFYFLTLVRMGEQSAREKHPAPSETSLR